MSALAGVGHASPSVHQPWSKQPPSQVWRLASSIRWHTASGVGSAPPSYSALAIAVLLYTAFSPRQVDLLPNGLVLQPPRIRGHSSPHPYPLHPETSRLHESGPRRGSADHRQPSPYPRTVGLYRRLTKSSCGNLTIITRHKYTTAASVSA
jgi:hypothetical protein